MKNFYKNFVYFFNRFVEVPGIEKKLFFEGLLLCYIFSFLTKIFPLKTYLFLLQKNNTQFADIIKEERIKRIKLVRRTLRRINKFNLFEFNCLTKAIVFKILLDKLGVMSNIVLSVNMIDNKILAHAYVRVNDRKVYLQKKGFVDVYYI